MGHSLGDSSTYVQFYMTDFIEVDFQEIVFGSEPQRDLIHLMGRLLRRGDAPRQLTEQQKAEIQKDPKLTELRRKREKVLAKIQDRGWTLKTAKDTNDGKTFIHKYERYNRQADSRRKKLHDQWLSRAIQKFHASADAEEIKRQLDGMRPSDYLAPRAVQYQLPERARIAKLFSEAANIRGRDELYELRISLMKELSLICQRREKAHPRQKRAAGKLVKPIKPTPKRFTRSVTAGFNSINSTEPLKIASEAATPAKLQLFCPFCARKCDEASIVRHISEEHRRQSIPFRCPYNTCSGIVGGVMYFADHYRYRHQLV